jgi:hypothetical protein
VKKEIIMTIKCPVCGMLKEEWKGNGGEGVVKNGRSFCCQGCADGSGCTCGSQPD